MAILKAMLTIRHTQRVVIGLKIGDVTDKIRRRAIIGPKTMTS